MRTNDFHIETYDENQHQLIYPLHIETDNCQFQYEMDSSFEVESHANLQWLNLGISLVAPTACEFVCFVALRLKSTAMVMAGRSVHLTTLFPGQA